MKPKNDSRAAQKTETRIVEQAQSARYKINRYLRHDEQRQNQPRQSLKRIRITTSNHNLRYAAAEKSSSIRDEQPQQKSSSALANYNNIKMRRLLREQRRNHQGTKSQSQTLEPLGMKPHLENTLQEEGCLSQQVMKDYISHIPHMLASISQRQQNSERNQQATAKKAANTIRKQDSMRQSHKLVLARNTIDYQDSLKKLEKHSEVSLTDTLQVRHTSSKQIHSNILSLIINKTRQQRKALNLKDIRDKYKQEMSASKSNKNTSQQKRSPDDKPPRPPHPSSRKLLHPALLLQPSRTVQAHPHPPQQSQQIIQQQDSRVQVSNFSSPLQLPKPKADTTKLNLDISIINKQEQSLDSLSHRQFMDLAAQVKQQPKKQQQSNRKKKLVDLDKFKKNFPVDFFDG